MFGMIGLSSVSGMFPEGNRVDSPGVPGMTPDHTPECQPAAPEETVDLEGLGSIGRAAGIKPASGRQQRRNESPVAQDQQIWHAPHRIPAGAPPWRQWFGSGNKHRLTRLRRGQSGLEDSNQGNGSPVSDRAGGPVLPGLHGNRPPEYSGGRSGRPTVPLPRGDPRFHFRNPAATSLGCP